MIPNLAVFCGDFTAERTVLLGYVPLDAAEGAQVRAIHLLAGERLGPDSQNYWLAQLGRLSTGAFKILTPETSCDGGFTANVARSIQYPDPPLLSRGDMLALRMSPRGKPSTLVGLSAVVEWGVLSSRRSARV